MSDTNHILTASGIESRVMEHGELVGHVLLMDCDATARQEDMLEYLKDLPGISLIFESSPGKHHVWNLTVRRAGDTVLHACKAYSDPSHVVNGARRGYWFLRTGPKNTKGGDEYKPAPVFKQMVTMHTDRPQSLPHMVYAQKRFDVPEPSDEYQWVGDAGKLDAYLTLTDEGKRMVEDGR